MRERPNLPVRMPEGTAAMMRPLIANPPERVDDYNRRWESVVAVLENSAGDVLAVPRGDARCGGVGVLWKARAAAAAAAAADSSPRPAMPGT